jgi:seryl-tRNA synthetase
MLQLSFLREHTEEAIQRLAIKNFVNHDLIHQVLNADSQRRNLQAELDTLLAHQNNLAKQVGELMRAGKKSEAEDLKNKSAAMKQSVAELHERLLAVEKQQEQLLVQIPNVPSVKVPPGKSAQDNLEVYRNAIPIPELGKKAKPHWELAAQYDLIDFELGNKITGAGFPVYKGKGARLQRALINFFLDRAVEAGYKEVQPPVLINEQSGFGTGQLPDKEGQMYHVTGDNLYLVPTAEVPVTNFYRDVILKHSELPVKLTAYTPCFRREAGSYGKEVRGLNRLHQFDKVEIVQIEHPDKSYDTLEQMKDYVASLIDALGLPFRIVMLCGGDMSFASALTYDFEVWSGAQHRWLEVSSVSNFETFQSNRMKLRFRDEKNKTHLAHTLNGSALALPRIVAALLENNQTDSGIRIPNALIPYTGFNLID